MKNRPRPFIFLLIVPLLLATAVLPALSAEGETITFKTNIGGAARGCTISGPTLFSVTGSVLTITDITDISDPTFISSLNLPGIGRRVTVNGNHLYVACWKGGLTIIDITSLSTPRIVSQTTFDSTAEQKITETFDVAVKKNYAYVADQTAGLVTLDITDPSAPEIVSTFTGFTNTNHHAYDVYIDGNYLFLSCELDGLYIFDISTLSSPVLYSTFNDSANQLTQFYQSFRDGRTLYIASGVGLVILDVSDLLTPRHITTLNNDYQGVLGLTKVNDYVYLCTEFSDFYKVYVDDPSAPVQVDSYDLDDYHSLGIASSGKTVALANHNFGIRIFDVTGGDITQTAALPSLGQIMDCQGAGNYAYIAALTNGLKILDISDPQTPVVESTVALEGNANGIFIDNATAYVAEIDKSESSGGYLEIINVSDPSSPSILATLALTGRPFDLTVKNSIAYISLQTEGLAVVNVSNPESPELVSTYDTGGSCYKPEVIGNLLYAADGTNGFVALDITDKTQPMKITDNFDNGTVQDIALWNTSLFLPGGQNGLAITDITLPYSPASAGAITPETVRFEKGNIKAAAAFNGYLLIAESGSGVRLFDLADPSLPAEVAGSEKLYGDPVKITCSPEQGLAYASSQIAGLYIYGISLPDSPSVNIDGRWVGAGTLSTVETGITVELDQTRDTVTGRINILGFPEQNGTLTATISDNTTLSGTVTFSDDQTSSLTLNYSTVQHTFTGSMSGDVTLSGIILDYAGLRGQFLFEDTAMALDTAVSEKLAASGDNPLETFFLDWAATALDAALAAEALSRQLTEASTAEAILAMMRPVGPVAAADAFLCQSAVWESGIAWSIAGNMTDDICSTYKTDLQDLQQQGDFFYTMGKALRDSGHPAFAMFAFGRALEFYEKLFSLYQTSKPECPKFDVASFDGYFEGAIDFGFSMGDVTMCVEESDNGSISGGAIIAIAATGENMGGAIKETTNVIVDDASLVNGYIQVFVGSTEAHVLMLDWMHNPATDQWEGGVDVDLQHVDATAAVKFVSTECPDAWYDAYQEVTD